MIATLLVIICIITLVTMHPVALAFALSCSVHKVFADMLPDTLYYLSAGLFDVLVIGIIAVFLRPSHMAQSFIWLCLFSLALNFYGWLIWFLYLPPVTYNIGFIVLYSVAIYLLLRKDMAKDERHSRPYNWDSVFLAARRKSIIACNTLQEESEN